MLALICLVISAAAHAEDVQFLAKETGFPNLEYSVKETANTESTSRLQIPGFLTRSAEASRWMMCVYTNIALMRHHPYWTAVYPQQGDSVLIGFPKSDNVAELGNLGPEFSGDYQPKAIAPVEKMTYFCAQIGYKFKYAPTTAVQ